MSFPVFSSHIHIAIKFSLCYTSILCVTLNYISENYMELLTAVQTQDNWDMMLLTFLPCLFIVIGVFAYVISYDEEERGK